MKYTKKVIFISASYLLYPFVANAQDIGLLIDSIGDLVDRATPVVFGIALLAFFWGLARYIFSAGDEEKKKEGRRIMVGGVIALFVMVAIWGIINFFAMALGIDTGGTIEPPGIDFKE